MAKNPSIEWQNGEYRVTLPVDGEVIKASWRPTVTSVFRIREMGTDEWSPGFETPLNGCSFIGLKPNTEYELKLTHKNEHGEGPPVIKRLKTDPEEGEVHRKSEGAPSYTRFRTNSAGRGTRVSMKNLTSSQLDQLFRLIKAFRLTAMLVDRQVDLSGLRPVVETTEEGAPQAPKLPKEDPLLGFAMMAAGHFNLGIALELGLKCLTALEGNSFETRHELTPLFDGLSAQSQKYLQNSFARNSGPHGIMWLDLAIVEKPDSPDPGHTPSKKRVSANFRDLCEHFDTEFKLKTKRYSPWEDAIPGKLIHYIHDSSGLFCVVEDIQKLIVNKSQRG